MTDDNLDEQGALVALVASEAAEESDAVMRHPEVVDVLTHLSDRADLGKVFGANGHDPVAFVKALAEGLAPYRGALMEDAPELVFGLAYVARALKDRV